MLAIKIKQVDSYSLVIQVELSATRSQKFHFFLEVLVL